MNAWTIIALLILAAGLISFFLLRREKNVPVRKVPVDIKDWAPKHYVDETAEFAAITPGRHATDTAWAMPALRPEVTRVDGEMPTMWTKPRA